MSLLFDDFDLDIQKTIGAIDNEPNSGPHCTYTSMLCPTNVTHQCAVTATCVCHTVGCPPTQVACEPISGFQTCMYCW